MEAIETTSIIEPVTMSEVLGLETWNRPRTEEELKSFVAQRAIRAGLS